MVVALKLGGNFEEFARLRLPSQKAGTHNPREESERPFINYRGLHPEA